MSRAGIAARSRIGVVAVGAAGAALLTACVGPPGAAAFVGEDRIADATVQGWVSSAMAERPEDAPPVDVPSFSRQVLSVLIQTPLLEQTADRLGIEVDDAAVEAAMRPQIEAAGGPEAYAESLAQQGVPAEHVDTWTQVRGMQLVLAEELVSGREIDSDELRAIWVQDPVLSQLTFEEAEPEIRRVLLAQESGQLLIVEVRETAEAEGVEVSQRYGIFDEVNIVVEPALPSTVRPPGTVELDLGEPELSQ